LTLKRYFRIIAVYSINPINAKMTLKDTFSKYTLTPGQHSLLHELEQFLADQSRSLFLLKGYAGTGKTFMMKGLTDFLTSTRRSVKIMAPTGRAAKIISQKTKYRAYTIHKTIYSTKDLKEFKTKDIEGTETFKFYYDLKNNDDLLDTVYIVDEASLLSDVYSESEFFRFGSGYLLQDLIRYINADSRPDTKVIFVGDDAQLPPIGMAFSPALDEPYLSGKRGLSTKTFELTEVVRQTKESGILHNATRIRASLKTNIFNSIEIDTSFDDINDIRPGDLLQKYLQAGHQVIGDKNMIIAYSNEYVHQYNLLVRNHFFPGNEEIAVNDKILLVSNNYNYQIELLNGDYGIIRTIIGNSESRTTTLKKTDKKAKVKEIPITISYRDILAEFKDLDGTPHVIECKILENLLYSAKRDLTSDEQKAMYIDFWIRNPKLNQIKQLLHAQSINYEKLKDIVQTLSPEDLTEDILKKIKKFQEEYFQNPDNHKIREISVYILKDALRNDPYFNALKVKFGYAITCHKAQGGEWNNIFIDCQTSMGYFNTTYFRWLYTGITRGKEQLFVINKPHFTIDSHLQPPKMKNTFIKQDIIELDSALLEEEISFNISEAALFTRHIFLAIRDYLKDDGVTISDIKHTQYLEHYTFTRGDEKVVFKVHYNAKNKITSIEKPASQSELVHTIFSRLTQLQNKTIIIPDQDVIQADPVFEFDQPFLKIFYEKTLAKLSPFDLRISKIEHNQNHEIYEIIKNGHIATYKFWYNEKGIFKKTEIIGSRTTGLTEEINKLL